MILSINSTRRPKHLFLEVIALLLILALAAYLRLANHADDPGWYTDEGTHIDIAQNLLCGRVQYLAINRSTLLFAKLPLFEILLAGLFGLGVGDGGIGTLRAFTGVLGVVSVAMLYLIVRRAQRGNTRYLPLLSALMLAIYPQAVLYNRFGFSYNLLEPLVLLSYLGLWVHLDATPPRMDSGHTADPERGNPRRAWLALAALAVGIGGVSDLWMFALVPVMALVISVRRWRDMVWSLALVLLPFGLYAVAMLVSSPHPFLFDLRYTLSRLNRLSMLEQLRMLTLNYTVLISQDWWVPLGLIGLFTLRPARLQRLSLILFLLPLVVLGRTAALFSLSSYYMIPLLPFVALGMAALVERAVPTLSWIVQDGLAVLLKGWGWSSTSPVWQWIRGKLLAMGTSLVLLSLIATPFLVSAMSTVEQIRDGFTTSIDPFLIDPGDARQVAEFARDRIGSDDLVIASPGLVWLFQAKRADFVMSLAFTGQETALLPGDIPVDRFAFDPRYTQARFVVVDNLWRNWAVWDIAGVSDMMQQVEAWPRVLISGEIEVYCNPMWGCDQ
jgi:hypothetical protein